MNLIEALREPKVGPFAIFDLVAAFGAAWVIAPRIGVERKHAMLAVIPLGVLTHEVLGISTPLNRMVFDRA